MWYTLNADGTTVASQENIRYTYDSMGNITEVYYDGELAISYEYDSLGRLTRENNKALDKTTIWVYDNCGNVLRKKTYDFTLRDSLKLELMESTDDCYAYDGDKLLSYNNESCTYNSVGNPTIYRGKAVAWQYENRLVGYDTLTFAYDAFGRRISKGELTFTYDSEGRLVSQSNGLKFFYDHTGVAGFTYNNQTYFYMKSVQGDISALLDSTGGVLARYMYDAWGNHVVTDNSGVVIIDNNHVGNLNPFRYRGYYYDTETNFYYLKARYYDPVVGRFISMDDIAYLDPETINGLNLYAYGLNNPVMNVDPSGHFPWLILVAIMLFTPVGGMVAQATVSTLSYVGMAVGSIFDEDIRNDMVAIGWNPFNENEAATLNSNKVSFYKGVPVFRTNAGGRSGSFGAIFLTRGSGADTLRHERGHNTQLMSMGILNYAIMIGLPSWQEWSDRSYYERPWEITADVFGGVTGRTHSQVDINRGYWYLAVSSLFGPLGYLFLFGEYNL